LRVARIQLQADLKIGDLWAPALSKSK